MLVLILANVPGPGTLINARLRNGSMGLLDDFPASFDDDSLVAIAYTLSAEIVDALVILPFGIADDVLNSRRNVSV